MKQRTSLRTQLTIMLLALLCAGSVKAALPLEIGIVIPTPHHTKTWHIIIGPIPIVWYS